MTETKYVDPGHRLPDEDWARVVARAEEVRKELLEGSPGGASGPGGIVVDMTEAGIRSKKFFGVSGIPTQLLVLHSAECPLRAGFAISLTEWFQATVYPGSPIASWQRFVDPVHRVRALPDELGAWHASEANPLSIGWEQAGYARYSRAEWTTPDGLAQLELLAFDMAEVAVRDGIPARWLTDWEVRQVLDHGNREIKGFCLHRQIDPETRTDPGGGYPYDLLMSRIKAYMGGETPKEDTLSAQEVKQIIDYVEAAHTVTRGHVNDQAKATREFVQAAHDVTRGYLADTSKGVGQVIKEQLEGKLAPDVDADQLAATVIAAVGKGLAKDVVAAMGAALQEKEESK